MKEFEFTPESKAAFDLLVEHYGKITAFRMLYDYCRLHRCGVPEASMDLYERINEENERLRAERDADIARLRAARDAAIARDENEAKGGKG